MSLLAQVMAPDVVETNIMKMGSELVFLLESSQIPRDIIAKFGEIGYTDMDTFSHMDVDTRGVRTLLKDDVGLDPAGGTQHKSMTARILAAWDAAGKRSSKLRDEEAAQRAGDLPRHATKSKHLELTRAYKAAHRELREKERPAPAYLDWRFEQVEDGELKAEALSEVINREEAADDDWDGGSSMIPRVNPDGTIRFVKARSTGKTPDNPEGLREKIKLMGVAWEYVRLRFPTKPYLVGLVPQDWTDHVEWLLGEDIYQNTVKDAAGTMNYRPSWATVLELDYRVRKRAYGFVNDASITLGEALARARPDTALLQKFFYTPVSLAAGAEAVRASTKRPAPAEHQHRQVPPAERPLEGVNADPAFYASPFDPRSKGRGGKGKKGKGKKSGKGKKGSGPQVEATPTVPAPPASGAGKGSWRGAEHRNTPDGRLICFAYQKGRCNGQCGKIHVCTVCLGQHGRLQCPRRPAQGDAAGDPRQFQ